MPRAKSPSMKTFSTAEAKLVRRVHAQETTIKRLTHQLERADRALGDRLRDLCEVTKDRDHALADFRAVNENLSDCRHWSRVYFGQIAALRQHIEALSQRYVGVKLDAQQLTFASAQDWLSSERQALTQKLCGIEFEHHQNQASQMIDQQQRRAA